MKRQRPLGIKGHAAKRRRLNVPDFAKAANVRRFVPRVVGNTLAVSETKYTEGMLSDTTIADKSATDSTWAGTELDIAAENVCAQMPGQASTDNGRDGRRILVKKIRIKGTIKVAVQSVQGTPDRAGIVRLVLYQDKQTNGTQAQGEDLLARRGGAASGDSGLMLFQNPNNIGRFKVYKDKLIRLQQPQLTGAAAVIEQAGYEIPFSFSIKPEQIVNFDSANASVGDIVDNSWHLIGARSGSLACTINYVSRTYFQG